MKIYKKLYSIKYENILIALTIPLAISQFIKANEDFRLLSIVMSLILYGGLALAIRIGRKEALEEIRLNTYEPLIDIEEMLTNANVFISNISRVLKSIKKRSYQLARYINDQAYILRNANIK